MRITSCLKKILCCAALALSVNPNWALAAALPLYPDSMIREWAPEFRDAVQDNYVRLFQPKLSNAEAQRLRNVRFEFPLDQGSVLFEFHSRSDGSVVMPVAALLFLKDLATAQAWLEESNYSPQTVLDYLGIIRQGRLENWPVTERLPLQALGIPANALQDKRVLDLRNEILDKSILFILGHELGHVMQEFAAQEECSEVSNHGGPCDFQALQQSESLADAFAVDLFRRIGLVPSASTFFFAMNSRLEYMPFEFKSEDDWQKYAEQRSHPLNSARIAKVATLLDGQKASFARGFATPERGAPKISESVRDLMTLSDLIEDRDVSGLQIAWANSLVPEDIKPRRSHEPKLRLTANDLNATQPLSGYFKGEVQFSNGGSMPLEVVLWARGNGADLIGVAMLRGIRGEIEGSLNDRQHADATWSVAGDTYRVSMVAGPWAGQLNAAYRSKEDKTVTGRWILQRSR